MLCLTPHSFVFPSVVYWQSINVVLGCQNNRTGCTKTEGLIHSSWFSGKIILTALSRWWNSILTEFCCKTKELYWSQSLITFELNLVFLNASQMCANKIQVASVGCICPATSSSLSLTHYKLPFIIHTYVTVLNLISTHVTVIGEWFVNTLFIFHLPCLFTVTPEKVVECKWLWERLVSLIE